MLKNSFMFNKIIVSGLLIATVGLAASCRYDMQDQPKDKSFRENPFFKDSKDSKNMGSRPLIDGTVPRGYLREDRALYTGKKDTATIDTAALSGDGGKTQTQDGTDGTRNAASTQIVSYPDSITEFPIPVTKEMIDRGEERYRVFCIVCHGPNGDGNGMVVRRGFSPPPSYHTEQLRGAPVGHFYDVVANGWGRMSGYSAQIPVSDRWAIVAYIRTLQASKNPDVMNPTTTPLPSPTATPNTQAKNKTQQNSKSGVSN